MPIRKVTEKTYIQKKSPVTKAVKKYVKRAIHNNVENKVQHLKYAQADFATQITDATVISLNPVIARGTGQGDRIGNQITLRKATLHIQGFCLIIQHHQIFQKIVSIYLFKCRPQTFPTVGNMQGFLQDGNSAIQYLGRITDHMRPLNKDLFIARKQINKMMVNAVTVGNLNGVNNYQSEFM